MEKAARPSNPISPKLFDRKILNLIFIALHFDSSALFCISHYEELIFNLWKTRSKDLNCKNLELPGEYCSKEVIVHSPVSGVLKRPATCSFYLCDHQGPFSSIILDYSCKLLTFFMLRLVLLASSFIDGGSRRKIWSLMSIIIVFSLDRLS